MTRGRPTRRDLLNEEIADGQEGRPLPPRSGGAVWLRDAPAGALVRRADFALTVPEVNERDVRIARAARRLILESVVTVARKQ